MVEATLNTLGLNTETRVLKASIIGSLIVALAGIVLGLLARSFSITFDGVYTLVDAAMSTLSLLVVQLITKFALYQPLPRGLQNRFSVGFWHLEPMVLALNGILLMSVATYALLNAVGSLMAGGREIDFGVATVYAAIVATVCFVLAVIESRANKAIDSEFLRLDAKGWVMSGAITAALLIAFAIGMAIEGTSLDRYASYIDPLVLTIVCLIIIPMPIATVRSAVSDMLLIAPPGFKDSVDAVANQIVLEEGFLSFQSYVAKVGRAKEITLYFIVRPNSPPRPLSEWDDLRDRIGDMIGEDNPNRWLTIVFTEDEEWA
jgi:predicted Co/Zn/Cd cation transporter (cation efflux family)